MEGVREGRHLAAIMFVDMVGYSARMQENEPLAISAVRGLWELVRPILKEHSGREVDLAGDGMLMEFPGALSAVRCALGIHAVLHERNKDLAESDRILTRAGVHLGDIEHKEGRIYGDGINIAARLLPLSPAGSIVLSSHVRDQIHNVLEQRIERLGSKTLKNIKAPLEIWCIAGPDCPPASLAAARAAAQDEGADRRWKFGNAVLDERTLELTVDGSLVELEKKSLDVITFLLHHADEVVTKDEILEAVWPGRVESETVLTQCINRIREVLKDADQSRIKTVHGFGYRLAVPVEVEAVAVPSAPHFDFKEGDHPAGRPLWSLVRCLGRGGHGEVWLVRHDKTREERVYKFALDPAHLASLKREITLSRVLNDTHGARQCFVRVLDWNLEQIPYFIECEYSSGGSLVEWAESQGGLKKIPLETRLNLAAQIAEALAAAHSVGVLHKDLKPSNILVERRDALRIKLADFGSGGVLDPHRLEGLGITRMGFTKTILDASDSTSGTPIYLAPEILAGQPATSQADVYAMGVLLYQMIAADFRRPLAAGWEHDVADELLREDIAEAASGNPAKRLPDAAALAQRLRTLEERRNERAALRSAKEQAERADKLKKQYRRMLDTVALLVFAVGASLWAGYLAYKARNAAVEALNSVKAVSDFVSEDMLEGMNIDTANMRTVTVEQWLDHASASVEKRLAGDPTAAVQIYWSFGASYRNLGVMEKAQKSALRAYELATRQHAADPGVALALASRVKDDLHEFMSQDDIGFWQKVHKVAEDRWGKDDARALILHMEILSAMRQYSPREGLVEEIKAIVDVIRKKHSANISAMRSATWGLYDVMYSSKQFDEAEGLLKEYFSLEDAEQTARSRQIIFRSGHFARLYLKMERYEESERWIETGLKVLNERGAQDDPQVAEFRSLLAELRLEQAIEGLRPADDAVKLNEELYADVLRAGTGDDESRIFLHNTFRKAYLAANRLDDAAQHAERALGLAQKFWGDGAENTNHSRLHLADVWRLQKRYAAAWEQISAVTGSKIAESNRAPLARQKGLLWQAENKREQAREALTEAKNLYESNLGLEHRLTKRARKELAHVQP